MMPRRSMSPLDRARADGSHAAAREHARLGTNQSKPIDVFGIVEEAGVWLMFQPLRHLYGAYMREGVVPGIIVNSNHPLSVRRFTAAHEYGHHILSHAPKVDDERNLTSRFHGIDPDEAAAQAFAANFLMPLQLVNTMLRQMGLPLEPGEMSSSQVYLLSLNLGSSYPATINHLQTLDKIRPDLAADLRKEKPKDIKVAIGRGRRPPQVWADAWQVDAYESGKTLYPKVEDLLNVALPETPSTGYIWSIEDPRVIDASRLSDEETPAHVILSIEGSSFEGVVPQRGPQNWQDGVMRYGAGGTRHLVFRALRPGQFTLKLQKRRPWESSGTGIADAFEINLSISAAGTGGIEHGLSLRQWPRLPDAA
jgi:predicted secreted protein